MYCSRECQELSWKTAHRFTCSPMPVDKDFQAVDKRYQKMIDSWQHAWRGVLEHYSLVALDLANNPGKDATHCVWMELRFTGDSSHPRKFELVVAKVKSIEEILKDEPKLTTLRDPPHLVGERIHYTVIFHFDQEGTPERSFVRSRAWTDLTINTPDQRPPPSESEKRLSRKKAEEVFEVAKEAFKSGSPDEIRSKIEAEIKEEMLNGFLV